MLQFPKTKKNDFFFLTVANSPLIAWSLHQHGSTQQLLLLILQNPLTTCGSLTSGTSHSILVLQQPDLSTTEIFMTLTPLIPASC